MRKPKMIVILLTILLFPVMRETALAYPSGLNLIPTADVIGAKNLRLAYETDGHSGPFGDWKTEYIYTQFGLSARTEVGVDAYDVGNKRKFNYNLKYQFTPETAETPAVAFGILNLAKRAKPEYYLAVCKTVSEVRFHLGTATQSPAGWVWLGADYQLIKNVTLLADYQSGQSRPHSFGVAWQATPQLAFSFYRSQSNSRLFEASNYYGLYGSLTFAVE